MSPSNQPRRAGDTVPGSRSAFGRPSRLVAKVAGVLVGDWAGRLACPSGPLTLLWTSEACPRSLARLDEVPLLPDAANDVSLQRADCFSFCLPAAHCSLHVVPAFAGMTHLAYRYPVHDSVQSAVPRPVQAVPSVPSRRRFQGRHAGVRGQLGVAFEAVTAPDRPASLRSAVPPR